jgi:beta-phosphoglucomutase-like phosphatase (HAD superfamily)
MPDLQLVIFDCDGVLVDSEVISNKVLARRRPARSSRMRAIGYAADSDEHSLRNAGAEIIRSLDKLPEFLGLPRT